MNDKQRKDKIEEFVHVQRYLHGLKFHVIEDPKNEDGFIIEFAKASERQLSTLNHRLRINEMTHIRSRAIEVIQFENKKKKRR